MSTESVAALVPVIKDSENERPIPTTWRHTLKSIVGALVNHDYQLSEGIHGVAPVSAETAEQIRTYIQDYGQVLTELPEDSWNTSVCIWSGSHWDALIDLWTVSEGSSDLVLRVTVSEVEGGFLVSPQLVYVP